MASCQSWARFTSGRRGTSCAAHHALTVSSDRKRSIVPQVKMRSSHQCADRKSTRLNSSHSQISYAVFCLKKKIRMRVRASPEAFLVALTTLTVIAVASDARPLHVFSDDFRWLAPAAFTVLTLGAACL